MRRALCGMVMVLSLTVAAQAAEKKAAPKGESKTTLSPLLPAGEQPDSVLVLQKNDQGALAPVLLGKMHTATVEENGQQVEKPEPLAPGVILIIRDIDEPTAKSLRVTNGTAQAGGAYIVRQNRELEYLGQVDLSKKNLKLAKEFGIHGETKVKK
jgi:hypothetical protein